MECAINTLNGIHTLTIDQKSNQKKYKNRLRELMNAKISFKSKRRILVQNGDFIVPLLASVLSGVIGSLINDIK